jgi:hydroxyacylglutathione hydrolase
VQPGTPIVLVGDPGTEHEAVVRLARIGFDSVVGSLADPLRAFVERPDLVESSSRLTASEFDTRRLELADLQLVDVRGPGEVADGIVPGATVIQLPELVRRWTELDPNRPIVVYCAGGYRSSIAASTLRSLGCTDVSDLLGGYNAWRTLEVSA